MTDIDAIKQSVTLGDTQSIKRTGGSTLLFPVRMGGLWHPLLPDIPRNVYALPEVDRILLRTWQTENLWAGGGARAISGITAATWSADDPDESVRRTAAAQRLLVTFDGIGYVQGMMKLLKAYLSCRNGGWIELVWRAGRVIGIFNLDPLRTWATGDLQYPAIYQSLDGREHLMKAHQVRRFVDMPHVQAEALGAGMPAAERAYNTIRMLAAVQLYDYEKITGGGATKLVFIKGVTDETLGNILGSAQAEKRARGLMVYQGAIVAAVLDEGDMTTTEIELKGPPAGWDPEAERRYAATVYSNAIGTPFTDIMPLQGQGMGGATTQAKELASAASTQGLAAFVQDFSQCFNHTGILSGRTTIALNVDDSRSKQAKADLMKAQTDALATLLDKQIIDVPTAQQMAADWEIIPRELLQAEDLTPGGTLSSDEKPLSEQPDDARPAVTLPAQPVRRLPQPQAEVSA